MCRSTFFRTRDVKIQNFGLSFRPITNQRIWWSYERVHVTQLLTRYKLDIVFRADFGVLSGELNFKNQKFHRSIGISKIEYSKNPLDTPCFISWRNHIHLVQFTWIFNDLITALKIENWPSKQFIICTKLQSFLINRRTSFNRISTYTTKFRFIVFICTKLFHESL